MTENREHYAPYPIRELIIDNEESLSVLGLSEEQAHSDNAKMFLPSLSNFRYGNTKAQNTILFKDFADMANVTYALDIASRKDKQRGVKYNVTMELTNDNNIHLPENFNYTLQDDLICNSIGNLAELDEVQKNGGLIRAEHLVNIMNGDPLSTRVRDETVNEILEEVKQLIGVRVEINAEEHKRYNSSNRKKTQLVETYFTGSLLPVDIYSFEGMKLIQINNQPPLYRYAKSSGQMLTYDYDILDLTKVYHKDTDTGEILSISKTSIKRMSEQVRSIRDCILKEIGRGRAMNNRTLPITYARIHSFLDDDLPTIDINKKSTKQSVNRNIQRVLDSLQDKGLFTKWTPKAKGRQKLHSIVITLR